MTTIRLARGEDLPQLPEIEVAAAGLFRAQGVQVFVDEGPDAPVDFTPPEVWAPILTRGRIWVAETPNLRLVGFLAADVVEARLHVLELDVHPSAQGQGVGRRLMQTAIAEGRAMGLTGLSLTTFRDVAWNAPFYASLGFQVVAEPQGALAAFLAREATRGLDPARRCAMELIFQRAGGA